MIPKWLDMRAIEHICIAYCFVVQDTSPILKWVPVTHDKVQLTMLNGHDCQPSSSDRLSIVKEVNLNPSSYRAICWCLD